MKLDADTLLKCRLCLAYGIRLEDFTTWISPPAFQVWRAFYAVEPWTRQIEYLSKIVSILIKQPNWEQQLPPESLNVYDPLNGETLQARRRAIAREFSRFAKKYKQEEAEANGKH